MKSLREMYNTLKSILTQLGGKRIYKSEKLSGTNKIKVISAQRLLVLAMCSLRAQHGFRIKTERLKQFINCLNQIDVYQFFVILDEYDATLLLSVEKRELRTRAAFSTQRTTKAETEFATELVAQLMPFLQKWFSEVSETAFAAVHQVLSFCKRVSLDLADLREVAYSGWLNTENLGPNKNIIGPEKEIISSWFPRRDEHAVYEWFSPCHGNGQVAESCNSLAEKYSKLTNDPIQLRFLRRTGFWPFLDHTGILSKRVVESNLVKPCRVTFVNKSWKTYRTISMEPVTTMWLQQGLGRCIDKYLKLHMTDFAKHYAIDTELNNRYLAWCGSYDGSYDTIDLSSASDSVSWKLVKDWFNQTWLYYGLLCTRSRYCAVEYQGETSVYEQTKFAPMGSRLCFPVETIVFGAIAEASCRAVGLTHDDKDFPRYVVYGDDIVIRHEATPLLVDRLNQLGFRVNHSKSFTNGDGRNFFRESCGIEALNGVDVTPKRLPRTFPGLSSVNNMKKSPRSIACLIILANNLRHLPFCRWFLIDYLQELNLPIYWDDGRRGLWSRNPSNFSAKRRYNLDYQRYEIRIMRITRRRKPTERAGWVDYPYTPNESEFSTPEEYERARLRWEQDYETWYNSLEGEQARLYEFLRRSDGREHLLDPDDRVNVRIDPYEDVTMEEVWIPDEELHPKSMVSGWTTNGN